MFCINCGTKNEEGSLFCMKCGTRLEQPASQPKAQPAQQAAPQPEKTQKVNPVKPEPKAAAQAQPQPEPKPISQPVNTGNVPPNQNQYQQNTTVQAPIQEGCLSAAWHDIKSTPHWFKKICFMALCNIIPFLSFGTVGFAQQWGAEAAKGKRETMPQKVFNNKNFLTGLFEWITWSSHGFVYVFVMILLTVILLCIPVIGWILLFFLWVFCWIWNSYVSLAAMRGALFKDLGECFRVRTIFPTMKRRFGGILCAYILPSILCGIITFILAAIFIGIFMGVGAGTMAGITGALSSSTSNIGNAVGQFMGLMGFGAVLLVVFIALIILLGAFMSVLEKLLRYRALGHWIHNFAPDWIDEAKIANAKQD